MSSARILWRLCKASFAPGLDGEGARLQGGRWNSPGFPVVYTASTLSLAALEVMVHLPGGMRVAQKLPPLQAVALEVPEGLLADLPEVRDVNETRAIGDAWLAAKSSVGLVVPSRVIPMEKNVILNPLHPDFGQVQVVRSDPFELDPRLGG